eukprot:6198710-Pleurochrysis_carterae.AAC.3
MPKGFMKGRTKVEKTEGSSGGTNAMGTNVSTPSARASASARVHARAAVSEAATSVLARLVSGAALRPEQPSAPRHRRHVLRAARDALDARAAQQRQRARHAHSRGL